jgi:hypothetical protein
MFYTVDVLKVDYLVVDVLELDVLGVRPFFDPKVLFFGMTQRSCSLF